LDGLRCLSLQGPLGAPLGACRCDWGELADYRWLNSFSIDPNPIFNGSSNQCLTRLCVACAAGRLRSVAVQEVFSSFVVLATVQVWGWRLSMGLKRSWACPLDRLFFAPPVAACLGPCVGGLVAAAAMALVWMLAGSLVPCWGPRDSPWFRLLCGSAGVTNLRRLAPWLLKIAAYRARIRLYFVLYPV
jgi:hypothetical protein